MGKTLVGKKISWDWAMGLFKMFTLVFFVSLKLVRPGDAIENIIIQQTPVLEGLKIKSKQFASVIENFADKCLFIFDGMDEFDLSKNEEILKIIKGQKLLYGNVLVTSRPHGTGEIQQYFNTVVQVQGFNELQADKYLTHVLNTRHKSVPVMKFYHTNFGQHDSKFTSPMLLLFISILVNADEIDLEQKNVTLGEIYSRLVRCLYQKFTIGRGITFDHGEFTKVLNCLGKLAWETLNSKTYHLQQSEILKNIGVDAFQYGLLIGYEDFNLLGHKTADVFVTFLHSSIQDFLGGFYFVMMLNEGKVTESLLGPDHTSPAFMINPLVLYICCFFLSEKQMYLISRGKNLYTGLIQFLSGKTNLIQCDLLDMEKIYPALESENNDRIEKDFDFNILSDVFALCRKTTEINADYGEFFKHRVLTQYCTMPNLRFITLVEYVVPIIRPLSWLTKCVPEDELSVVINHSEYGSINDLLTHCKSRNKNPSLYINPTGKETDLSEFLKGNVREVYICGESSLSQTLVARSDIANCPVLTHLFFMKLIIDESVGKILSKAVENRYLRNLSHLSLVECIFYGFDPSCVNWSLLNCLDLVGCYDSKFIRFPCKEETCQLPKLPTCALHFEDACRQLVQIRYSVF